MATSRELIAGLSDSRAYPFACDRVELRQTPSSLLFFAGDRVYKVKKAVDLGFLDFTTLERRLFYCREELRLNARLAPEVYLGVVPIVQGPDGRLRIGGGGGAPAVEYAVEMRRLPDDRMLDRLLDAGGVDGAVLDALSDRILEFHRAAPTGPGVDEHGRPDAVEAMTLRNLREAAGPGGATGTLSPALHAHLCRKARGFLESRRALLEARVASGRIREGHGDLHAGNICITGRGIVIYDCIEFSAALRCGDVARDLAFLLMDLEARGHRDSALRVAARYAAGSGDRELDALLPFYKAHLACVRGKVNALAAADPGLGEPQRGAARLAALRYFCLAAAYTLPAVLVLMCGLPGSGKSWVADRVAGSLGAAILRSDVVRKQLAGVPLTHHPIGAEAEALYAPQVSQRTYEFMLQEAQTFLASGRPAVIDATFPTRAARAAFVRMAAAQLAPLVLVHVTAPDAVVAQRMRSRPHEAGQVSDADWEVYRKFQRTFEPPREIPPALRVEATSPGDAEPVVAAVIEAAILQRGD